jgi:hypothetical protein
LNIESVENPANTFRVEIKRDMPVYGDTNYPSQFLNGRGQNPIYEPFVMDRMGYTVYGKTGIENKPSTQVPTQFMNRLLFSYTDPALKKDGEYFVNRIAVRQHVTNSNEIKVYRIRRQWGQQYINTWPAGYNPPGPAANTCDGLFFENQGTAATRWQDCLARANNQTPPQSYPDSPSTYSGGIALKQASSWKAFEQSYKNLLAGKTKEGKAFSVADFINNQTFYYDAKNHLLYFYMIEDQPVQQLPSPYGTCGGGQQQYAANVQSVQQIKNFSNPNSVQAALDASCLASNGVPQPTDLFACGTNGCAAYMVDFTAGNVVSPSASSSTVQAHPISRREYSAWNQYKLVYSTPSQQPNGLPVVANPAIGNTAPPTDGNDLADIMVPLSGQSPIQGNQISYSFLPLTGSTISLTQNFPYRCVTTPPWSPVNARGAYLANGGNTYPISNSVCMELDALYQRYTMLTGKKQAAERFKIKKQIIELSKQIVKQ